MYALYFKQNDSLKVVGTWEEAQGYVQHGESVVLCKVKDGGEARRWSERQSQLHASMRSDSDLRYTLRSENVRALVAAAATKPEGQRKRETSRKDREARNAQGERETARKEGTARDGDSAPPGPGERCELQGVDTTFFPTTNLIASTDGACQSAGPNGTRRAAWAVVWHCTPDVCASYGLETTCALLDAGEMQTNQRAELAAVVSAVRQVHAHALKHKIPAGVHMVVRTDSQWVIRGFTDWMPRMWKRNGWKTVSKQDVKHADLWRALDGMTTSENDVHVRLELVYVMGHSGDVHNERADRMATSCLLAQRNF